MKTTQPRVALPPVFRSQKPANAKTRKKSANKRQSFISKSNTAADGSVPGIYSLKGLSQQQANFEKDFLLRGIYQKYSQRIPAGDFGKSSNCEESSASPSAADDENDQQKKRRRSTSTKKSNRKLSRKRQQRPKYRLTHIYDQLNNSSAPIRHDMDIVSLIKAITEEKDRAKYQQNTAFIQSLWHNILQIHPGPPAQGLKYRKRVTRRPNPTLSPEVMEMPSANSSPKN
ncbi:unnamed protein product [Notodromas monacha]|uniref:Uncharacterized protein n=1 Tax=Notodromas monacha TaxID=399045 RepID=A0A7R9C1Y4_9CRUS|nr:unnamed protein product [Notodromas monacha]CAG0924832.1 unnamed protein product [Notodromas monacha]